MQALSAEKRGEMKRRDFFRTAAAFAAAAPISSKGDTRPAARRQEPGLQQDFVAGEPVLESPAENSIGVAWAVNRLSTGCVEIADNLEMKGARIVKTGELPLACLDDQALVARVTGLKPATRYWYRTVTQEVLSDNNPGCAKIRKGKRLEGRRHSFVTPGAKAESRFCVMNDTHAAWKSFAFTSTKLKALAPPVVVWNGDALNCTDEKNVAVRTFLSPLVPTKDYASEIPVLWVNGNHDFEGMYARHLGEVMIGRDLRERKPEYLELTRNFAVRQGDIALVGLDTGEGIHDDDARLCGLGSFSRYRTLQTLWLEDALSSSEVSSAPFVVAFCHIPLWNTGENPFGCEEPREKGCASWIRECYEQWGPVLDRYGVQLVVCGHEHYHRWDDAIPGFRWKQVVGGGPELGIPQWGEKGQRYYPTLIEGKVTDGKLAVKVHDTWRDRVVSERTFLPRSSG